MVPIVDFFICKEQTAAKTIIVPQPYINISAEKINIGNHSPAALYSAILLLPKRKEKYCPLKIPVTIPLTIKKQHIKIMVRNMRVVGRNFVSSAHVSLV